MRIRTLLIDGSFLLKRSFDGAKYSYENGKHIGGLYSFLTTTRKLIREHGINKVIVFWDGENGGKLRYLIDNAYKANRKSKSWYNKIQLTEAQIRYEKEREKSLLFQRKRIQAYLEELFIRQIEVPEIEADDLISAYCYKHNNIEEMYLYTIDRDFLQLLNLNIKIIFDKIPHPIDLINFNDYFDFYYLNALTIKIICGDVSDNIKGIEGIKETTLLKHFPILKDRYISVNEICLMAKKINDEKIENKKTPLKIFINLLNNIDRLKINYQLIDLSKPKLNDMALEELEQLEMPLSDEDRNSNNLYKLMLEDGFLKHYGDTFPNYVQPFYTVIMQEKQFLKEYKNQ